MDGFTTKKHREYISLYYNNSFVGNFDNYQEIREAKVETMMA